MLGPDDVNVCTMFYCDGMGCNNPIGAFRNEHNLELCYYIVIELRPNHRIALHNIQPATIALKEHFTRYPLSRIIHGFSYEPANSTSFGMAMNRLGNIGIPLKFSSPQALKVPFSRQRAEAASESQRTPQLEQSFLVSTSGLDHQPTLPAWAAAILKRLH